LGYIFVADHVGLTPITFNQSIDQ